MSTPDAATVKQFVQCIAASTSSTSFPVCQGHYLNRIVEKNRNDQPLRKKKDFYILE